MYSDVSDILSEMSKRSQSDSALRDALLQTRHDSDPLSAFCAICRSCGYELWPMELVDAGEEMYAEMKRSTNGGGENSPRLEGEDDLYEMFLNSI